MSNRDTCGSISGRAVLSDRLRLFTLAGKDFSKIGTVEIALRIERRDGGLFQLGRDEITLVNNPAFKMENALLDDGCLHLQRGDRRQSFFLEFVMVPA